MPEQPRLTPEQALIALYATAEAYLLAEAARILRLVGSPLTALPRLRRLVQQTIAHLAAQTGPLVQATVDGQAGKGRAAADRQIARLPGRPAGDGGTGTPPPAPPGRAFTVGGEGEFFDLSMDHGDRAAAAIRADLTSSLDDVRFRITRLPDDIYKAIAPQAAIFQVIDTNVTAEQAQAAAWRAFVASGVTGFTDRSGRDWALSSYVEMAVRTASARAFRASSLARMQAVGFRYFTVPPHTHACPLCGPWQGAVLTAGPNPDPRIPTDGTIEEATAHGLFHPNCRDLLTAWDPATMPRPERVGYTAEDEGRYRATQQQRALERAVRRAKRAEQAALTTEARTEARADVRAGQARLRALLAEHDHLARQSRREQPNLRMGTQNLTPWRPPAGPTPPYPNATPPGRPTTSP